MNTRQIVSRDLGVQIPAFPAEIASGPKQVEPVESDSREHIRLDPPNLLPEGIRQSLS